MIPEIIEESPIESNPFQQYIHVSKYSRWMEEEKRRETWKETVTRYIDHMTKHLTENVGYTPDRIFMADLYGAIYNGDVMPSMRAMMTAGPALERSGIAAYNCSYTPIDHPRAFDEILYILAHGSGVGFSVENKYISKLPDVPETLEASVEHNITVLDSKEGWADSFRRLIEHLYNGIIPSYDVSQVRPKGAPLKTFGGYASGPEPLVELFEFTIKMFKQARGRKLMDIEVCDIVCYTGRVIVSGGVRRSALWCGSDLWSKAMATAKSGNFREHSPQRDMANISAVYEEKPDLGTFMEEWTNLYKSFSGERGIFNRQAAQAQAAKSGRRVILDFGTNPCGEIFLRPQGFCNLTEVVVREDDTVETLREKVRLATVLGTIQATITNFPYLRPEWQQNAEEERLLGVSLTGIMGNKVLNGWKHSDNTVDAILSGLRQTAVDVNEIFAEEFGINQSAAITCVKPSGTVSLLNGVSAGLHPWYSHYYIRSVRGNNVEPMTEFMKEYGIPNEPDISNPENVTVFYFPLKAPYGAYVREDLTALNQLEQWKALRENWCEHNPSITVQIRDDEWFEVADWVYKNFDQIGGIAFLPYDSGSYKQAPYQECDEETFNKLSEEMPDLNWSDLKFYERYDSLDNSKELSCAGNACEITDIGKVEQNEYSPIRV